MKDNQEFERAEQAIRQAKKLVRTDGPEEGAPQGKAAQAVNAVGAVNGAGQLGVSMFFCILIGFLLGLGLDRLWDTAPGLMLTGTALGAASAFKVLFDYVKKG